MISANFESLRILRIPQNSSEFPQNSQNCAQNSCNVLI